jgi:hypothetical protein
VEAEDGKAALMIAATDPLTLFLLIVILFLLIIIIVMVFAILLRS